MGRVAPGARTVVVGRVGRVVPDALSARVAEANAILDAGLPDAGEKIALPDRGDPLSFEPCNLRASAFRHVHGGGHAVHEMRRICIRLQARVYY